MKHDQSYCDLERSIEQQREVLERLERDLEQRGGEMRGNAEGLAREVHALLCLSVNCAGWENPKVRARWNVLTVHLLDVASSISRGEPDRRDLLRLLQVIAESPFYEEIRLAQCPPVMAE